MVYLYTHTHTHAQTHIYTSVRMCNINAGHSMLNGITIIIDNFRPKREGWLKQSSLLSCRKQCIKVLSCPLLHTCKYVRITASQVRCRHGSNFESILHSNKQYRNWWRKVYVLDDIGHHLLKWINLNPSTYPVKFGMKYLSIPKPG